MLSPTKRFGLLITLFFLLTAAVSTDAAAQNKLKNECLEAMQKATKFMVDEVSTNGGYLWHYLPDMSRRWGEMEAYETMIWVQRPGTTSMGHLFLDAYQVTGDKLYQEAADKAARALIWGQLDCGGWNYIIDFAGDRSLKEWYDTIGKNGWRLEEFQHYYGNATFDDDVSSDAAKFLLRMYLNNLDPAYKYPLEKAINFIMESQYPIGGWPQRYPLHYDFSHHGLPDYTSFYTFNDDVVWENVNFLLQCYQTLGEQRFLDPILKGMNFYLITQQGPPQAGWAQQYTMDLKPSGARTYEPNGILPGYTAAHIRLLIRFYRLTGETKFLERIPEALDWLESAKLPESMTEGGKYTHSVFVEIGTNKPIFVHRRGSNVIHGRYTYDYDDSDYPGHYGGKSSINIDRLRKEYEAAKKLDPEKLKKNSPLVPGKYTNKVMPQKFYAVPNFTYTDTGLKPRRTPSEEQVRKVLAALDGKGLWLSGKQQTSNPYIGDGTLKEMTAKYARSHVGDKTDTSPYRDTSDQKYITTRGYINNMRVLLNYVAGTD